MTDSGLRSLAIHPHFVDTAQGSCLIEWGKTKVLCCAHIADGVPAWRESSKEGWVTAEYAMLPQSGSKRSPREQLKRKGRSMEIERLVGRSLRAGFDMKLLGQRTVTLDCDVLQADGGTRCASIVGAWVAARLALESLVRRDVIHHMPLVHQVGAVSVGLVKGELVVDLDYKLDSHADVDLNVVATAEGQLIEVQGTGEHGFFSPAQLSEMVEAAQSVMPTIFDAQRAALDK